MRKTCYDVVVVGAGTAGCVLASRLSEDPSVRVALVESGPDWLPGEEPPVVRDPFPIAFGEPNLLWPGLTAEVSPSRRRPTPVAQGRSVGGSSNIMGMIALRGLPADYDQWRDDGAAGWGWDDVLPAFARCEHDLDFTGPLHGSSGPIPVRRLGRSSWPPFADAFATALTLQGERFLADANAEFEDGITMTPMSSTRTQRVSASMGYLTAEVRRRRNLSVLAEHTAQRLRIERGRVAGIEVLTRGGSRVELMATETILCAGALFTPAILMRSGIGPREQLQSLGIPMTADLPGVGANLGNHPMLGLAFDLRARGRQPREVPDFASAMLRWSSGLPGCPTGDLSAIVANRTSWHPLSGRVGYVATSLVRPFSTGDVRLTSADPCVPPSVRMNLLTDDRDVERMVRGMRRMLTVLTHPQVCGLINEVFVPPGGHANRLVRPTRANYMRSLVLRGLFALGGPVRRTGLRRHLVDPDYLLDNEGALRALVDLATGPVGHFCGTARIGQANDRGAVVDPGLRVNGVEGLRVADASVMPRIVSANTHLPVLMIGEHAARLVQEE